MSRNRSAGATPAVTLAGSSASSKSVIQDAAPAVPYDPNADCREGGKTFTWSRHRGREECKERGKEVPQEGGDISVDVERDACQAAPTEQGEEERRQQLEAESRRLRTIAIRNLPRTLVEDDLRKLGLEVAGEDGFEAAELMFHHKTKESRQFGFASFRTNADAKAAVKALDGRMILNRQIKVEMARQLPRVSLHSPMQPSADGKPLGSSEDTGEPSVKPSPVCFLSADGQDSSLSVAVGGDGDGETRAGGGSAVVPVGTGTDGETTNTTVSSPQSQSESVGRPRRRKVECLKGRIAGGKKEREGERTPQSSPPDLSLAVAFPSLQSRHKGKGPSSGSDPSPSGHPNQKEKEREKGEEGATVQSPSSSFSSSPQTTSPNSPQPSNNQSMATTTSRRSHSSVSASMSVGYQPSAISPIQSEMSSRGCPLSPSDICSSSASSSAVADHRTSASTAVSLSLSGHGAGVTAVTSTSLSVLEGGGIEGGGSLSVKEDGPPPRVTVAEDEEERSTNNSKSTIDNRDSHSSHSQPLSPQSCKGNDAPLLQHPIDHPPPPSAAVSLERPRSQTAWQKVPRVQLAGDTLTPHLPTHSLPTPPSVQTLTQSTLSRSSLFHEPSHRLPMKGPGFPLLPCEEERNPHPPLPQAKETNGVKIFGPPVRLVNPRHHVTPSPSQPPPQGSPFPPPKTHHHAPPPHAHPTSYSAHPHSAAALQPHSHNTSLPSSPHSAAIQTAPPLPVFQQTPLGSPPGIPQPTPLRMPSIGDREKERERISAELKERSPTETFYPTSLLHDQHVITISPFPGEDKELQGGVSEGRDVCSQHSGREGSGSVHVTPGIQQQGGIRGEIGKFVGVIEPSQSQGEAQRMKQTEGERAHHYGTVGCPVVADSRTAVSPSVPSASPFPSLYSLWGNDVSEGTGREGCSSDSHRPPASSSSPSDLFRRFLFPILPFSH